MIALGMLIMVIGVVAVLGFAFYALYDMSGWWGVLYLFSLLMIVGGFLLVLSHQPVPR